MSEEKNTNQSSSRIDKLIIEMEKVTSHMKRYYSLKNAFLRGIIYGLGFVLGTTIVAGILLTLTKTVFKDIPFQQAMENKIQGK